MSALPDRLQEIVENFTFCEGQEKLEYLLELAGELAPLPDRLKDQRAAMEEVHECMTPIFMLAERENGVLHFQFDIPPVAPTVRGFGAMLQQGLDGCTPLEVLAVPGDFYLQTGLHQVLSGQRLNGLGAILAHMKRLATEETF